MQVQRRNLYDELMTLDGEAMFDHLVNTAFEITGVRPGMVDSGMFEGAVVPKGVITITPTARIYLLNKQRGPATFRRLALMHPSGNLEVLPKSDFESDSSDRVWALRWRLPIKNLLRLHCGKPQPTEPLDFARLKLDAAGNRRIDNEQVIALIHLTEELARMNQALGNLVLQHNLEVPRQPAGRQQVGISDYLAEPVEVADFLAWLQIGKPGLPVSEMSADKLDSFFPSVVPYEGSSEYIEPGAPFYLTGEYGYALKGILRNFDPDLNSYHRRTDAHRNAQLLVAKHKVAIEIHDMSGDWIETIDAPKL